MNYYKINIDNSLLTLMFLDYLKFPLLFVLYLCKGGIFPPLPSQIHNIIIFLIIVLLALKALNQNKIVPLLLVFSFFIIYLLRAIYYEAPLLYAIMEYINEFLLTSILVVHVIFPKKKYLHAFQMLTLINSIVIIICVICFAFNPGTYLDFMSQYDLMDAILTRGETGIISFPGLFPTGQTAATISMIGFFVFLNHRKKTFAIICFLGSMLTLAKSFVAMFIIGILIYLVKSRYAALKKACFFLFAFLLTVSLIGLFHFLVNPDYAGIIKQYNKAANSTVSWLANTPLLGNGFRITHYRKKLSNYLPHSTITSSKLAAKLGYEYQWNEFALFNVWLKNGILFFTFYYSMLLYKSRKVAFDYSFLACLLVFSNFHYKVTDFYLSIVLIALLSTEIHKPVLKCRNS